MTRRRLPWPPCFIALTACNPFVFDDLKDETWVQVVDRDNTRTSGDFGTDVLALPSPAEGGVRLLIGAGVVPGLARITLGPDGDVVEHIGNDATGAGLLRPLKDPPTAFALLDADHFLVGASRASAAYRFNVDLDGGETIHQVAGAPLDQSGFAIVAGDLGLGGAAPDVVIAGQTYLYLRPDGGTGTEIACDLKSPNGASSPVVNRTTVALTTIAGKRRIVVSSWELDNSATLRVLDPAAIQNGTACPTTGFVVPSIDKKGGPVALVVGDLDGNGVPEIVAATTGSDKAGEPATGRVLYYGNVTETSTDMGSKVTTDPVQEIAVSADETTIDGRTRPTNGHGARLLIGDADRDGHDDLLVADPAAPVDGISGAGRVLIYAFPATCDAAMKRGPACLTRIIHDPAPSKNVWYGRGMTFADFKTASGTTRVLAITQKAKLWVYFKLSTATEDPRE